MKAVKISKPINYSSLMYIYDNMYRIYKHFEKTVISISITKQLHMKLDYLNPLFVLLSLF